MKKLNMVQRLFVQEVCGEVTDKEYSHEGIFKKPVTLYTITQKDGSVFRGALIGHNPSLDLGDRVEMHLEKYSTIAGREEYRPIRKEGKYMVMVPQPILWKKIREYTIL